MGILSLLLVALLLVVILLNYFLSDRSEYLEYSYNRCGLIEVLCVIGIILTAIGFGFWWGFKPVTPLPRINPNFPIMSDLSSQSNSSIFKVLFAGNHVNIDPNFTPVDLNKLYNGNVPPSAYI